MKRIFIIFFLFACLVFRVTPAHAQEEFSVSTVSEYNVSTQGTTFVTHTITLTNLFSSIHAVSYSFILHGTKPQNIRATESGNELPILLSKEEAKTTITVNFPKAVVGKGKLRTFNIQYEDNKAAVRNGQVWEITIPKVEDIDKYESYNLLLVVPKKFGEPAYLSPKTERQEFKPDSGTVTYFYTGDQIAQAGVVAAFGDFQVFKFELSYHLKNYLKTRAFTEIALPPDTAFQRVYYESFSPNPISIKLDEDGNWLGIYQLNPGEQLDVKVEGSVQLFTTGQDFYPKQKINLQNYLVSSEYWQVEDPDIVELARKLKTPEAIYEYVVDNLVYDYSRVREGVERLGAKQALVNPQSAICTEFTDLFVALSRAAGIPAREINGFAYTENPELQPLSLVADVLHAWPEYWDQENQTWRPVDPTWGNTTGGVDYFSKFDLSHITFAIHGISPKEPLPAGSYKLAQNPQKDVTVFFGELPQKRSQELHLEIQLNKRLIPFSALTGKLILENKGSVAIYNVTPKIFATKGKINQAVEEIPFIAPFTKSTLAFSLSDGLLLLDAANLPQLHVIAENSEINYNLPKEILAWELVGIFVILLFSTIVLMSLLVTRKRIVSLLGKIFLKHRNSNDNKPEEPPGKTWRLPF